MLAVVAFWVIAIALGSGIAALSVAWIIVWGRS